MTTISSDLSQRIQRVAPSATIGMSMAARALSESGIDVISLAAGQPDFAPPQHILDAVTRAMNAGQTGYTQVDGTTELREAIRNKFLRDNNLDYSLSEINVSPGGKAVIANAFAATLSPGDEAIVPTPAWVSYTEMVKLFDGVPVTVRAGPDFKISPEQLDAAITPRTRWLLINSPGNPTGAVYSRDELAALGEVLLRHDHVMILSDDIYEHICFGVPFATMADIVPALKSRTLTMNGVSKAYAMTGFRIGYAGGPEWLIRAMRKVAGQTTSCPASISQAGAVAALNGPQHFLDEWRETYRIRRDAVLARLNTMSGISADVSDGAFYIFAAVETTDDVSWCERMLNGAHIAMVPGSAFHAPVVNGQGFVRLSYADSLDRLKTAMDRLEAAL